MALDLDNHLAEINGLIRAGKVREAADRLRRLGKTKLPSHLRAEQASLLWRAGMAPAAVRLLHPVVRPPESRELGGTPRERCEYAAALTKIGAHREAVAILEQMGENPPAEALLYEAFAFVSQWDYRKTIPLLQRFIDTSGVKPYQRLVARVNLLAALVVERHAGARPLLNQLLEETKEPQNALLAGYVDQLEAQWAISERNWDLADTVLNRSAEKLRNASPLELLFIEKWRSVVEIFRSRGSLASLATLKAFRERAIRLSHWETVRDCDLYRALVTRERELLAHLYFGSPHPAYRERIMRECGEPFTLPQSHEWEVGKKDKNAPLLKLFDETLTEHAGPKPGQVMHRLLATLSSDFYRPTRLATVHSMLYPNEYFNPRSSPNRVHRAVTRVREWLRDEGFPIEITEADGSYWISTPTSARILIPSYNLVADTKTLFLDRVREFFADKAFSVKDVSEKLATPSWTVLRALHEGVQKGLLNRSGKGSKTRYAFPTPVPTGAKKAA